MMEGERKRRQSASLYDLLELPKGSSHDEIRAQYKRLAIKYHPDKNPGHKAEAEEIMKEINYAHDILGNKKKRKIYDKHGTRGIQICEKYGYRVATCWWACLSWTGCLLLACCISPTTCGFCGLCCCCCCEDCINVAGKIDVPASYYSHDYYDSRQGKDSRDSTGDKNSEVLTDKHSKDADDTKDSTEGKD